MIVASFTSLDVLMVYGQGAIKHCVGNPECLGTDAHDIMIGDNGHNNIKGLKGNDDISGNGGNDSIRGGEGLDKLQGGTGDDFISAFGWPHYSAADGHKDVIDCGPGNNDKVYLNYRGDRDSQINCEFINPPFPAPPGYPF